MKLCAYPACLCLYLAFEHSQCRLSAMGVVHEFAVDLTAYLEGMVTLQYSRTCPTQFEPKLKGKLLQIPAIHIPLLL